MAKGQGGPACHPRGTKLPCWRTRHVDKRNEKELEAIKLRKGGSGSSCSDHVHLRNTGNTQNKFD